jgi:glycosyltransferase involved in cell wall biosynthesis
MRPPRLLLLSTYYHPVVGGSETHARQLARYLGSHGFEVSVLTKRVGRDALRNDRVDGVAVRRVGPAGARSPMQKWLMLPSVFGALIRWRSEFDVVYSPDYRGIGVAGILGARLLRRPVAMGSAALGVVSASNLDPVLAGIGLDPAGRLARGLKRPLRRVYRSVDAFTAMTRAIEREAIAEGIPADRVHYLPNSVDVARFCPARSGERDEVRRGAGWPTDRNLCLFLARLSREKGLMDLLEAWRGLRRPDRLLAVVGPDMPGHPFDAGPAARAFVRAHAMEQDVLFAGPTDDPARLLRAADVFVQPSHWEAAPFGVLEAMATGLPIVATRVGGMAEYLRDAVNALLVEPREPAALAARIACALEDRALADRLGAEARRTVVEQFDEAVVCARYAALFASLASGAGEDR